MEKSEASNSLPHDTKSIDIGDFVIVFLPDKILVSRKIIGDHFTLHCGEKLGMIDIHRTWVDSQGCEKHTSIFAMRRERIPALLEELGSLPCINRLLLLRPLRLEWLRRQGIRAMRGVLPVDQGDIERVTRRGPKRRLVIDQEKLLRDYEILTPGYLERLIGWPDGQFILWKNRQMIGIAFKATDPAGCAKFAWLDLSDVWETQRLIMRVALRYAIPKGELQEYEGSFRN
jgi:hypothetical protein